jgi:nucleoside-diphosphate-sugar epimerase
VTGSSGHLGEALVRALTAHGEDVVGLDLLPSPGTSVVGSVSDRDLVLRSTRGVGAVLHTATLHKPHIGTHGRQAFIDTNISGTLNLLEAAVENGIESFVFTSTTSAFGRALTAGTGQSAVWITEDVVSLPRNIYGVTKSAAEDLCELFQREYGLPCVVLRVSRFFPEPDDSPEIRQSYDHLNLKVNELLYRRVDLEDVVTAHQLALERAPQLGFERYVISATTPFTPDDVGALATDVPGLVRQLYPDYEEIYRRLGWTMLPAIDRVYVNARARRHLGWAPRHDFRHALDCLRSGRDPRSELALDIGAKGYHAETTGIYTTRTRPRPART